MADKKPDDTPPPEQAPATPPPPAAPRRRRSPAARVEKVDPLDYDDDGDLLPPEEIKARHEARDAKKLKRFALEQKWAAMRKKAFEARMAGFNWDDVARVSGYSSAGAAYAGVQRWISDMPKVSIEETRQLFLGALSTMQAGAWKAARQGDPQSIAAVRGLLRDQSELLGMFKEEEKDDTPDVTAALIGFLSGAKQIAAQQEAPTAVHGEIVYESDGQEAKSA